jgi:hypothetical protein
VHSCDTLRYAPQDFSPNKGNDCICDYRCSRIPIRRESFAAININASNIVGGCALYLGAPLRQLDVRNIYNNPETLYKISY